MTRMSQSLVVCGAAFFGLACAEWEQPAGGPRQDAQPPGFMGLGQNRPAVDPDLANAPVGDRIDAPGDTAAAEAVRKYLADLDAAQTSEPRPKAAQATRPVENAPVRVAEKPATQPVTTPPAKISANRPGVQANAPMEISTAPQTPATTAEVPPDAPRVLAVSLVGNTDPVNDNSETPADASVDSVQAPGDTGRAAIDDLIEQASAELAKKPSDAKTQWRLSLLRLAAGQPAEAGDLSPELTERQRGLLARQVALNAAMSDLVAGESANADAAYAAAGALRDALRQEAELELPTLALCVRVTTFGVYEEMPQTMLAPYQANRAIVYCEIRNLAHELDETGRFRTQLATRLELFTEDGASRWTHEEAKIEDLSRQRREDFFIAQLVTLPADLGPGAYVLKATVTDLLASKTNETTTTVNIGDETALSAATEP